MTFEEVRKIIESELAAISKLQEDKAILIARHPDSKLEHIKYEVGALFGMSNFAEWLTTKLKEKWED